MQPPAFEPHTQLLFFCDMTTFRFTSGAMQNPHSEFLSFETSWASDIQPISECSMTAKTFCEKHAKHENTNVLEMFLFWNNHSHPHVGDAARAAQPQQVSDNGHSTNAAWCKKHQIHRLLVPGTVKHAHHEVPQLVCLLVFSGVLCLQPCRGEVRYILTFFTPGLLAIRHP